MLKITIPKTEAFDEKADEFITIKEQTLSLEHSLVSISKWESKWHKPYLSKERKTVEETLDYLRCMTLTQNVDPRVYYCIPETELQKINDYIEDPMTATWFSDDNQMKGRGGRVITSELLYFWMTAYQIPFECQKWHLNRLITLIRVCDEENKPKKKMSKNQILARNAKLNKARREAMRSRG